LKGEGSDRHEPIPSLDGDDLRASDRVMPGPPQLINRLDHEAEAESFDVTVTLADDETASITGPALPALFDRLAKWGPGAANASFDLDLGGSTLSRCKVMQYAAGHVLLVRYNSPEDVDQ
jgi:hypothetical protein